MSLPPPVIAPVAMEELPAIAELARRIWRAYYPTIISPEQIEYMLHEGYNPEVMAEEVRQGRIRYDCLTVGTERIGFVGYGPSGAAEELKLHRIYLLPEYHHQGHGSRLLRHVESTAAARGFRRIVLTVNKRNQQAINAYLKNGFTVRESAVFDIGKGFVMDDYIFEKTVQA